VGVRLRTEQLGVSHGGIVAVADVDLELRAGEVVGLIGPNGAGKTSTVDAISGFVPHRGRVLLDGRDLSSEPPHVRVRAGLARTWQTGELFEDLTVRQHCELAARPGRTRDLFADLVRPRRRRGGPAVGDVLEALELSDVADALPVDLPLGRQKLVGVARALAARPVALLLDEPAAGLDSAESLDFGRRLRALVDATGDGGGDALAVLLIDHDTELVLGVCDRVAVLDFGSVIATGTPAEVRADSRVVEAYLGVGSHRGVGRGGHDPGGAAGPGAER
jgi:branched-chain amino acid transport system ATP-binding protein